MADYTLMAKISADTKDFEGGMQSAQGALSKFSASFGGVGDMFSSFGGLASSAGKALAPITGGMAALGVAAGKTTVDFMKVYQASMTTFKQFLGSDQAARQLYNSLYEVASASTFSQEAFLSSAQKLVAYGVSADDTTRYMQVAADAVSAFGGTSEDLEQLADAFGKVKRDGKLTGESLQMMANSGVDAVGLLSKEYGVSTDELRKMVSQGLLPADEALGALSSALEDSENGFAGMAEQLKSGSITGALDSMNSAWRNFSLNLIGINPTIGATDEMLAQSEQRSLQFAGAIGAVNSILPVLASAFTGITDGVGTFLSVLTGTEPVLNSAGDTIGYTGGLLTGLADVFKQFKEGADIIDLEPFKNGLQGLIDVLPPLPGFMQNFIDKLELPDSVSYETFNEILTSIGDTLGKLALAGAGLLVLGGALSFVGRMMTQMNGAFMAVKAVIAPLGAAFAAMSLPMMAIVVGVGLLIAAFAALMATNEEFRASMMEVFSSIAESVMPFIEGLKAALSSLFEQLMPVIMSTLESLMPLFMTIGEALATLVENLLPVLLGVIESLIPVIVTIFDTISQLIEQVMPVLIEIIEALVPVITRVAEIFGELVAAIMPFVATVIETVMPIIGELIELFLSLVVPIIDMVIPILDALMAAFDLIFPIIKDVVEGALAAIKLVWDNVFPHIQNVLETVFGIIQGVVEFAMGHIEGIINLVTSIIEGDWDGAWQAVQDIIKNAWDFMSNIVDTVVNFIKGIIEGWMEGFSKTFGAPLEDVKKIWEDIFNGIKDFISGFITDAINWGKDLIGGFIDGIMGGIQGVTDAVSGIADTISSFLHFSEPDVGPLSNFNSWMPDMMGQMASQIKKGTPQVASAIGNVASIMAKPMESAAYTEFTYGFSSDSGKTIADVSVTKAEEERALRSIARNELERANLSVIADSGELLSYVDKGLGEISSIKKRGF